MWTTVIEQQEKILKNRKSGIKSVVKDMGKLENLHTASENVKWSASLKNSMAGPEMIKHKVTVWPRSSMLRYLSKRNKNMCPHKTYTWMFIVHYS